MSQVQVNTRVDAGVLEVLEAAAFVAHSSVGEMVRAMLVSAAEEFRQRQPVITAMEARRQQTLLEAGTLTGLAKDTRRREPGERSAAAG